MKLRQSPTGRAGTRRLATAVIAAGLVVAACSSSAATPAPATSAPAASTPAATSAATAPASAATNSGNLSVTFVPKNLGNPYFDTSDKGGEKAVKEFGGTYDRVAPTAASPSGQVPFINTLMQQGVGAIALSATDPQALCDALNAARKAGVKVVTYDSDTNKECRDVFVLQATAEGIAKAQVDIIAKQIGDTGEIAFCSGVANAPTQNGWIDLMKKDLAANHPNIKVVDTVYGDDVDQTALDKVAGLIQAYPNLKGIVAPDTVCIAAGGRYLQTSEKKGKVALTGLGLPLQMKPYVLDGTVQEFALWDPGQLGYLASYAAKALIEGTITGKQGDKFDAGSLGSFEVGADGVVLLGPPTVFDKNNIEQFNF
jgi:rhamnose transport system substrate-binding protein